MAQQQALSPTQLAWVREPLSELLKQVRLAFELQGEVDDGNNDLSGSLQHMSQLAATLRMLGIEGAAQAVDEMRELADDLVEGRVKDPQNEALGTLMGGTVVVDDYLDRLQIGQSDLPLVLLPLVNDVRAARGIPLLSEGAFFKPDLNLGLPPIPVVEQRLAGRDLGKLRQYYQSALRNWLRDDAAGPSLHELMVACDALAAAVSDEPEQRMWRVAMVVAHGLQSGHLNDGIGIKRLLVRLDIHLKRLLDKNADRAESVEETDRLACSMLFYLAMADEGNQAVEAVASHYRLAELLPDRSILDQAWGSVRGRNRDVFESVAKGVLDELLNVKDTLDLQMRAAQIDPEAIRPLNTTLTNAANTLEMLNVASAAELVRAEAERLDKLVDNPEHLNQDELINVATSLLQVEAHILRAADAMGEVEQEKTTPSRMVMGGHEFNKVVGTLLAHTLDNLHLAQQQLEQWLSGSADKKTGTSILRLLEEASGAVQMLELSNVSALLLQAGAFLREEVIEATERASEDRITNFADAVAAIEIYLTSLRDQQGERADLMQRATQRLSSLGYAPGQVIVKTAPLQPDGGAAATIDETESQETAPVETGGEIDTGAQEPADEASEEPSLSLTGMSLSLVDEDETTAADAKELAQSDADRKQEETAAAPVDDEPAAEVRVDEESGAEVIEWSGFSQSDVPGADDRAEESTAASTVQAGAADPSLEFEFSSMPDEEGADDAVSTTEAPVIDEDQVDEDEFIETFVAEDEIGGDDDDLDLAAAVAELTGLEDAQDEPAETLSETEAEASIDPDAIADAAEDEGDDDLGLPAAVFNVPRISVEEQEAAIQSAAEVAGIDPEFLQIFLEEFDAEQEAFDQQMPRLLDNPYDRELLEEIRRSFHTLKGSGRMVGAAEVGEFAWEIEDVLNRVLDERLSIDKALLTVKQAVALLPALKARLLNQGADVTIGEALVEVQRNAHALANGLSLDEVESAGQEAEPVVGVAAEPDEGIAEASETASEAGAEDIQEEEAEEELDSTLAELIRNELEEHASIIKSFLDDSDYRGWAEVPSEALVRAVHTIAGNLGLANWPVDTDVLHLVERYLRELGAMRKPPDSAGLELLRDTLELTNGRLQQLAGGEVFSDTEVAALKQQAQGLLDQLYQQLEDELAEQQSGIQHDLEQHGLGQEARASEDQEGEVAPPVIDDANERPAETKDEAGKEAEDAFDLEPFANFNQADDITADDPWADSFAAAEEGPEAVDESAAERVETSTEDSSAEGMEVSEEWLTDEDFAILLGDQSETVADQASASEGEDAAVVAEQEPPGQEDEVAEDIANILREDTEAAAQSEPEETTDDVFAGNVVPIGGVDQHDEPASADSETSTASEQPLIEQPAAARATTMDVDYTALDSDLLDIFLDESEEILEGMDQSLLQWREEHEPNALFELRRHLHTLKGGARMAGLDLIGDVGHQLETMLEVLAPEAVSGAELDTIQQGCDELHGMLEAATQRAPIPLPLAIETDETAAPADEVETAGATHIQVPEFEDDQADLEASFADQLAAEAYEPASPATTAPAPARQQQAAEQRQAASEVVRVNAALLDSLVNYAGEISIFRSRLEQEVGSIRTHVGEVDETVQRLRDQLRKLELETEAQILSRFQREADDPEVEFDPLEMDRYSTIQQLSRALAESVNDLISLQEVLDNASSQSETLLLQQARVNTELQEGLMQTRLVPFASLAPRLRRVVRRAAAESQRKARLDMAFEEGEGQLDRNVLERITAPLEHMLRNAVVHGVETPEERAGQQKEEEGCITISVDREATELLIRVADDGRGINLDKVRKRAEQLSLTTAQAQLAENEILNFIFSSGFSTASELTELAGRGVGMDVVANEVRQLGGSIDIETELGQGTRFNIRIPLTLAVMQAIMVRAGERSFAIPLTSVRGVAKMSAKDYMQAVEGSQPVYEYGGREYPLMELDSQLGLDAMGVPDVPVPLLMIEAGESRAALRVMELQSHREIVVKPVGPQISSIQGILGGTITGDGQVVIILDMGPLIRRALSESRLPGVQGEYVADEFQTPKRTPLVLVVDDSITMRKVTSRVLENRKLEVMTARDGLDAVEVMYERVPDLILLDIEMPRMDGYELATHVRNDPRLREIPMMIISSRSGEKHRQRGEEVGVERYLGKPYREAELVKNVFELLDMDSQFD